MKFKIRENIYSGNTNNKINKKKYRHALSPFCKMNAGNVEFNVNRFNHMSSGESSTSSGEGSPNGFSSGGIGESYLTEDIAAVKRQYSHIPENDFDEIIKLDPTFNPDRDSVGKYGKWLLGLYKKDNPLKYDVEEIADLLDTYDRMKNDRNYQIEKDINKFKSFDDMQSAVDSVQSTELSSRQKERELRTSKDYKIVYKDDDWTIYVPLSYAGSCTLGKGTNWCTAYSDDDSYYKEYTEEGPLYILINNHDKSQKYQFHFESRSYMNKNDKPIKIDFFLGRNPGVSDFFENSNIYVILKKRISYYETHPYIYDGSRIPADLKKYLKSIEIPNSVIEIRGYAFEDCTSLKSIEIPNSVTTIWGYAFAGCTSLESIKIPNSVTYIGMDTFKGCTSLKSIEIPNSVTEIPMNAFEGCKSLESIKIPNSVTTIEKFAFTHCDSLKSIKIPNSVTGIWDATFAYCLSLQSIEILDSVTYIGDYAFAYCPELKTLRTVKNSYAEQYFKEQYPDVQIEYMNKSKNESLEESSIPTYTFSYKGPVYRFEKVYTVLDEPIYTTAQNLKHASTILKGKLKKQFGFDYNAKLDIDDDKIRLVDKPVNEYQFFLDKQNFDDAPDEEWIGNFMDNDIYFSDGRYMANRMEFSSMSELQDYLED